LGYQSYVHSTILSPTIQGVVTAEWLTGSDTLNSEATVRNIAHTLHPVANRRGAGARKIEIPGGIPLRIGMPGNNDQPARLSLDSNERIDQ